MIEHRCTSRECGKITVYENTAQRPSNCIECGRAVIETWLDEHNPVRQAKQGLLARAMALFDKKVDRELDEVLPHCGINTEEGVRAYVASLATGIPRDVLETPFAKGFEENVNAVLQETAGTQQPRVSRRIDGSAFDRQEGGSHYADFEIQPSEFILANGLGFVEGNVIKYVCRHRNKHGAEDLRKAIHYIEMLLETEYGEARHGDR